MGSKIGLTAYRYYFNGQTYFPAIPVLFLIAEKRVRSLALVDSGATISIFNEETAGSLGIEIEKGKKTMLSGVGGRIVGYIHKLRVKIAEKEFMCPIVFSREYLVSFNLLGRQAFFKKFRIIFEEKKNLLKLE